MLTFSLYAAPLRERQMNASNIPNGHTAIRVVHSPDDGGYYAVKEVYNAKTDRFDEWSSKRIYGTEEDCNTALRLKTVKWEAR